MSTQVLADRIEHADCDAASMRRVLTPDAMHFLAQLHEEFDSRRIDLLEQRRQRQNDIDAGDMPDFLAETSDIRRVEWRVAAAPRDLQDRRVEIFAPAERSALLEALNSGANVCTADLEDGLSPTWRNVVSAQLALQDAAAHTLVATDADGRSHTLNPHTATLMVRPRGLHLVEKNMMIGGVAISASLFDFGLDFFHNATARIARGSGPYYDVPKLESRMEARLWNDIFLFSQHALGIPAGTIRATVLIETVHAAFEMDEILYELREHVSALHAGRWDYIFSFIKTFRQREELVLPDRAQLTMATPFVASYMELLIRTSHRRGAHAIGGTWETLRDATARAATRDAAQGFDGTWVARPDLVDAARAPFDAVLGSAPHQKHVTRADVRIAARDLLDPRTPGGCVTRESVDESVEVVLRYLCAWLAGHGVVAIQDVVEDAATAEIARAQLWQWRRHHVAVADDAMSADTYRASRNSLRTALRADTHFDPTHLDTAVEIMDRLVLSSDFLPFLTLPAYRHL